MPVRSLSPSGLNLSPRLAREGFPSISVDRTTLLLGEANAGHWALVAIHVIFAASSLQVAAQTAGLKLRRAGPNSLLHSFQLVTER